MALPLIITPLLTWLGAVGAKFLTDSLLKFLAFKVLAVTLFTVVLPVVLKNLLTWLFGILTAQINQVDLGSLTDIVVELNGLAAWFAVHLRFMDCFSVLITAMVIRLTLNFIPFIG
ncbi:MAG: hypothetical protein D3923_00075 [Candidatus Electrothrix sp. AR3]|nr:hypothetical protein [Candidatus Electrothrix sp. AR3]